MMFQHVGLANAHDSINDPNDCIWPILLSTICLNPRVSAIIHGCSEESETKFRFKGANEFLSVRGKGEEVLDIHFVIPDGFNIYMKEKSRSSIRSGSGLPEHDIVW